MINFEGSKYFKIDIDEIELTDESDHRRMILFNIMSDASGVIDMDLYKKTPIASIIFTYDKDDFNYSSELAEFQSRKTEDLAVVLSARTARKFTIINSGNSEYDYIANSIPSKKLHPSLFIYDMTNSDRKVDAVRNYIIAAIPCRGIITPLKKSKGFELYNGELVMTGNFDSDHGYICNRIVYVFAQVNSYMTIEEYYHEPGEYIGLCTTHTIGGLWHSNVDTLAEYEEYVSSYSSKQELVIRALNYKTEHFIIPYDGNENLFKKTGGNIFSVSTAKASTGKVIYTS